MILRQLTNMEGMFRTFSAVNNNYIFHIILLMIRLGLVRQACCSFLLVPTGIARIPHKIYLFCGDPVALALLPTPHCGDWLNAASDVAQGDIRSLFQDASTPRCYAQHDIIAYSLQLLRLTAEKCADTRQTSRARRSLLSVND